MRFTSAIISSLLVILVFVSAPSTYAEEGSTDIEPSPKEDKAQVDDAKTELKEIKSQKRKIEQSLETNEDLSKLLVESKNAREAYAKAVKEHDQLEKSHQALDDAKKAKAEAKDEDKKLASEAYTAAKKALAEAIKSIPELVEFEKKSKDAAMQAKELKTKLLNENVTYQKLKLREADIKSQNREK